MMTFSLLSLFPEQVLSALEHSITGRALKEGRIRINPVQIRDFAINDYGQVDDAPFGGGRGMLMMCEPVFRAWEKALSTMENESEGTAAQKPRTLFLSPKGRVFDQKKALELSRETHIILLCGHYEGIDTRVLDEIGAEELSIGDFVLTGGELAAAVVIDAVSRLIPGVLSDEEAWQLESFSNDLLEEPQYTRPREWHGRQVPEVLLSGHQANIDRARTTMRLLETLKKRPGLLEGKPIDRALLEDLFEYLSQK